MMKTKMMTMVMTTMSMTIMMMVMVMVMMVMMVMMMVMMVVIMVVMMMMTLLLLLPRWLLMPLLYTKCVPVSKHHSCLVHHLTRSVHGWNGALGCASVCVHVYL